MHAVSEEAFFGLVEDAIRALPPAFSDRIENLTFSVEDRASLHDLELSDARSRNTLLGLYRGVPLTERGWGYQMTLPDSIVLFQGPLQQVARDAEHLAELVRQTVRHEVAHYFGISDERLRDLGAY